MQVREEDGFNRVRCDAERSQIRRQPSQCGHCRSPAGVDQNDLVMVPDDPAIHRQTEWVVAGGADQLLAVLAAYPENDIGRRLEKAVGYGDHLEVADAANRPACGIGSCHCHASIAGGSSGRPRMRSDAFSAIINTAAFMWADTMSGITEASTTRRRSMPCTRSCGSTTLCGPRPIMQLPAGWCAVMTVFLI